MDHVEPIKLEASQNDSKVVLRIVGNLDGNVARQANDILKHLHGAPTDASLSIDLSGMVDFDYFGLVHLVKAIRDHANRFQQITITGLKIPDENIFRRFGLESGKSSETVLFAERFPGSKHHGKHLDRR